MRSIPTCFAVFILLLVAFLVIAKSESPNQGMQAGVATIDITPTEPIRLSGYGSRTETHQAVAQPLHAKALAIQDQDRLALLVTADSIGIPAWLSTQLSERLEAKAGLSRGQIAVTATHTHTGPAIHGNLPFMFRSGLTKEEKATIERYSNDLLDKLENVSLQAIGNLRPAKIDWGKGELGFAVNRRILKDGKWAGWGNQEDGPVDHTMPMMRIRDQHGKLYAVLANYACHCTTLGGKFNRIHGDWAGVAREEIEQRHSGATALITIGCGADQNPGPRSDDLSVVESHGKAMADEVDRLLKKKLTPVTSAPKGTFREIELAFDPPKPREYFEQRVKENHPDAYFYAAMLAKLDAGEKWPESEMYEVQSWTFGDELAMVFLAGEVVVDFAKRFYREFDADRLWLNAYANDVPLYVPSRRLYDEGGYEVDSSMVYYGKPARLAPDTEERVAAEVMKQIPRVFYSAETRKVLPLPIEKEQALSTIHVADGFLAELVAAEPLVQDPVDIAWDIEGRMWVVEMADYPNATAEIPGGRVRFLEDTSGDGFYDKSTLFLDNIPYPNSVMPWRDGILVTTAEGIFLAKDTEGDGRADYREPIIEGLPSANPQHQLGGLQWGLDGWVHSANELRDSGREIKSPKTGKTLNLSSGDLRFHPDTGEFALRSGRTQFGLSRDDWGNWFGSSNSRPWWHCPLDQKYLNRNANVAYPGPYSYLGNPSSAPPVFPSSKALKRFNDYDKQNRITSACNVAPYRDTLFGEEASRSLFVAEPVHNLVTRIVLEPNGATFSGKRASTEQESEFFASSDNWSRPTAIRTGPDGAIYVVDMYRFVIEHTEWIPEMWQRRLDLHAGHDKGRIYRIRPTDKELRKFVPSLESENGVLRDLAHQNAVWNGADDLEDLMQNGDLPQTRLQAMAALGSLGGLTDKLLETALSDSHPGVRRHAIRLSERRSALLPRIAGLATDEDAFVRQQAAYSLGEFQAESSGVALATLLRRDHNDPFITAAAVSSAEPHIETIVGELQDHLLDLPVSITKSLFLTDKAVTSTAVTAALQGEGSLSSKLRLLPFADRSKLDSLLIEARNLAANPERKADDRIAAIGALDSSSSSLLLKILDSIEPQQVQSAALKRCSEIGTIEIARHLLKNYSNMSSRTRYELLNLFVSRTNWTPELLKQPDLIKRLDATQRASLTNHIDASIRQSAMTLLQPGESASAALERFEESLTLPGNPEAGRTQFAALCSSCHKLEDTGFHVGPDLAALTNKSREALLLAIVDPDQALEDKYALVSAEVRDGSTIGGIATSESATSVSILGPGGVSTTVPRTDLKSFKNLGISLMPRGLEAALNPQQMADLLVYLQQAGNSSGIQPDENGSIRLTSQVGVPQGAGIKFDPRARALSQITMEDTVTWKVESIPAGNYAIFFRSGLANNGVTPHLPFELQIDGKAIRNTVDAGSITNLRSRQFGEFRTTESLKNVEIVFRHHFPKGRVAIGEIVFIP